jgi:hypothetical protein
MTGGGGMGARGVTRPMAEHEHGGGEHGPPYSEAREEMLRKHHEHTLWVYWTLLLLGVDEVVAMGQHLVRAKRKGVRLWDAFWKGGPPSDEADEDERSPALIELATRPGAVLAASVWGMSVPWTLAASAVLGGLSMAVPDVFGVAKPAAAVFHLGGALALVVAVVCMGEPLRLGRYLNVLLGLGLAVLPWVLGGAGTVPAVLGTVAGGLIALFALPRGVVRERYGGWDRWIR